jgi:LPPG:FO 2-phospho-L-lactate transferase
MATRLPWMRGKSALNFPGTGPCGSVRADSARVEPGPNHGVTRALRAVVARLSSMRITVLAGGIGAARFLRGLRAAVPDADVTVIGNTGDDFTPFGLHVSPDLDTVMYTLGGGVSEEQGWGRADETHVVLSELAAYGAGPGWFGLGDRDIATHVLRSQLLAEGRTLSHATRILCQRWQPGVTLLPMSDDPVRTHVTVDLDGREQELHFQEWWVRLHAAAPALKIEAVGATAATPAPGVLEAIDTADFVLLPPSNPVVSTGVILAVPDIAAAVRVKTVVGVSPIIGGAPVRGMADKCLAAIGVETSAAAVGAYYGADLLDGWLVDDQDAGAVDGPELAGIVVRSRPLYMTSVAASAEIARAAVELALEVMR